MRPLPLSPQDQDWTGDVWTHANGTTRILLKIDGIWMKYRDSLADRECTVRDWRTWKAQARLVRRSGRKVEAAS